MDPISFPPIAGFEIVAHLDSGGMADVFLARRPTPSGVQVAVFKVLRDRYKDSPEVAAMFRDEARIMRHLRHPNVVAVFDHGQVEQRPYIGMEYLAGDHLGVLGREAANRGEPLSFSLVTRICIQVANALDYIHTAADEAGKPLNLVHRDISPQNILVTYDGRIKILDFGIALTEERSVVTRTGLLKGKVRYMSPEQVEARPLDGRSDLFSLGIVMWELLNGRRMFNSDSEYKIMRFICEEPLPTADQFRPDLPGGLAAVVTGLLQRDPDRRTPSAAGLRALLMDLLQDELGSSPPDEIVRASRRLLSERMRAKQEAIDALRPDGAPRTFLFAGLEDPEAVSSSSLGRPSQARAVAERGPGPVPGGKRPGPVPWVAAGAAALALALLAGSWALLSGDPAPEGAGLAPTQAPGEAEAGGQETQPVEADAPAGRGDEAGEEPAADEAPAAEPDAPAEADEAEGEDPADDPPAPAAAEPAPPRVDPDAGFLMVKTRPETQVMLGKRLLGKTPITDLELAPGDYDLLLINEEQSIRQKVRVTIRKGEVSAVQYLF